MSQAFRSELRRPSSSRIQSTKPATIINYEKREKLKELLVQKFQKKYHLQNNEKFVEEEVKNFLHKEILNENDLKQLDQKIQLLVNKKKNIIDLENKLKNNDVEVTFEDIKKEKSIASNSENRSIKSALSGASKISQMNKNKKELSECDLDDMSVRSHREPIDRVKICNEKDEWNAINIYNQQMFELDKIEERKKDQEIKNRTKLDLDNQIRQKQLLQQQERLKNKEYDKITIDHVELLNKLEEQRNKEKKDKMLREKESRDAQKADEKKRKKIEEVKKKKYEKELSIFLL